jgi:hypothetical protein
MLWVWRALVLAGILVAFAGIAIAFPFWFPTPPTSAPNGPPGQSRATAPYLTGWADARLRSADGESTLDFATRVTGVIYSATYHCRVEERGQTLAAALAAPRAPEVDSYGYLDPSILRCGFCHQRAFVLAEALRRGGVDNARAYAIGGHVVTLFQMGDHYYVADPDYGIPPTKFESSTVASIPQRLYADRVDASTLQILTSAYQSMDDDVDYVSHEWLMTLAARQMAEVREIERQLNLIGWFAFAIGLLMVGTGVVAIARSPLRKSDEAEIYPS